MVTLLKDPTLEKASAYHSFLCKHVAIREKASPFQREHGKAPTSENKKNCTHAVVEVSVEGMINKNEDARGCDLQP